MAKAKYQRVLLKLSGEALMGGQSFGIDSVVADQIASEIAEVQPLGAEIAIVIGGGNIFRGLAASASGMDRAHRRLHGHVGHGDERARAVRRD